MIIRAALRPVFLTALRAAYLVHPMAASAHEFWLEPTKFNAPAGVPIGVYVCNGSGFEGWSLPRDPRRIQEFVAVGPDGAHPVVGLEGAEPAGIVRLVSPGGYVLAYSSNRAMTVQPDEKFDEYLKEKGLDAVLAIRNKEGHRGGRVRETYSRYAKTLVRVGESSRLIDRAIDLPLELVAEKDLLLDGAGNVDGTNNIKTFRLLHRGRPLAGALVAAMRPGTTDTDITARTDSEGRAQFDLRKDGAWRIAAVHMVAPPADIDSDWDSLWASLTFELSRTTSADTRHAARDARCLNQVATPALRAQR